MTKENFRSVIVDCINKNDYSTIISRTTYEERYNFFFNGELINDKGENVFDFFGNKGFYENLFTEEEAKNLLNSFLDTKSRYIIILNLSDEEKIKYIKEILDNKDYVISNYPYVKTISINKFFSTFKNKEIMSKTCCDNFNLYQELSQYEITNLLQKITDNYKEELFNKIVEEQLDGKKNIINSFSATSIINSFPENKREEILDILIKLPEKSNSKEEIIETYSISSILDCFSYENKKNILKKLYKHFKEKDPNTYISRTQIIKMFNQEDIKDVIKIFIKEYSDYSGIYKYEQDIETFCTDYHNTKSIIDMTFELEKEENVRLLSGYTLNNLISKLLYDEKINIFYKYIIEDKKIDIEEFILNIPDIDFKYSVLELLIEKKYWPDSDIFKIVNIVVQQRNYEKFADGKISHPIINDIYCEKYNLNKDNFSTIVKKYGYIIVKYLDNQNIINALNLSSEEFIKYLEIFNKRDLNSSDINNICNSLLQREFRLKCKEDYNIFSTIEKIIGSKSNNAKQELTNIINKINEYVDIDKYLEKYEITQRDFIELLLVENTNSINILHELTNKYIAVRREKYANERLTNINEELFLDKKLEKQYYKRTYINQIAERDIMYDIFYKITSAELDEEQLKLTKNRELLSKIIKFKKNPSNTELTKEEKEYLKVFESILNILYEKQIRDDKINNENAKYSYFILSASNEDILNIMTNINIDNLQKNILNNNELYHNLIQTIEKYHFTGWHKTFTQLAENADISLNDGTVAGLISYFNEIYPKLNNSSNYLTNLLDYGNLYDYSSLRYKYLLGKEDFALIAANEGRNKASMSKYKRLEKSVSFVKKMYERKNTTIPPIDKNFTISNGKTLNVVVGNTTNMMNLTYGERTEACLRIGGAFADLFDFCISDENGFHIRFTNPTTGKFVSRVSGIRNGNTLFLNELRESVDETYNNEELIETLKAVTNELIKISQNSNTPIDNVIITSDYALKEHESEEMPLNLNNDISTLYNLSFNLKLASDKGIILTTSSPNGNLMPYKFDRENVVKYECQRDKVKIFYGEDSINRINQMHIINELLSGQNLENIELINSINCNFCVSGEDWYIARTVDNQIIKYIMPNSKNKEIALNELNMCYENIEKLKEEELTVRRNR